jgi:hypothetical protein
VNTINYSEKLVVITDEIYNLIDKNPQLFNDMAFLKDIYNRVSDEKKEGLNYVFKIKWWLL